MAPAHCVQFVYQMNIISEMVWNKSIGIRKRLETYSYDQKKRYPYLENDNVVLLRFLHQGLELSIDIFYITHKT